MLARHFQDDIKDHTKSSVAELLYVRQVSFIPLNLLNVYPINGSAMSADCSSSGGAPRARAGGASSSWLMSSIGKYDTSVAELRRGSKGARMERRPFQSTPWKKGCALISMLPPGPPWDPRRSWTSQSMLWNTVSLNNGGGQFRAQGTFGCIPQRSAMHSGPGRYQVRGYRRGSTAFASS